MRRFILCVALLGSIALSNLACGDGANGPDSNLEFKEFGINNPISLFELLGIELTNLQTYFFVDWTDQLDLGTGTAAPVVRTFARAFTAGQSANNFVFRGLDMGEVTFSQISGDTVSAFMQLGSVSSVAVGFDYRQTAGQISGTGLRFDFRFVATDRYRFTRLGTSTIDSLSIDFFGPSDSLSIAPSSANSAVSGDQELGISWQGGLPTESVLILLQPVFEFSNGYGFASGLAEFLTSNSGAFTLPASGVQALLDHANEELLNEPTGSTLTGIFVYVALPVITEVVRDQNRSVVIAFTSDQLFLPLQASD